MVDTKDNNIFLTQRELEVLELMVKGYTIKKSDQS